MNFKLVVTGAAPWDGEYPFDFNFSNRELNRVYEISGVLGGDLFEMLRNYHAGAYVAVACVVLQRHGKNPSPDDFWDIEGGNIAVVRNGSEEEPADVPLDQRPDETSNGESGNTGSSGPSSESDSG